MISDYVLRNLVDEIADFVFNKYQDNSPVPLHEPDLGNTNSLNYLKDCIDKNWVSSGGEWVENFEKDLCKYTQAKYAIAVCNGTVALRLALHIVGVQAGDEVLVTPTSFVATANAISHLGASPHFIDIEGKNLAISASKLDQRLKEIAIFKDGKVFNKITKKRISALLPVHVFGIPGDCEGIGKISKKWKIPVVEDSAEALGSWHLTKNKFIHCGLFGDIGTLSFNGNKIITTGGGGALLTNNRKSAEMARHISTTAKVPHPWDFFHDQVGWNDRMPNINAALGCAQLENINYIIDTKKKIYNKYANILSKFDFVELITIPKASLSNNWLVSLRIKVADDNDAIFIRNKLLKIAHERKIFLRPIWKSLHKLPMYINSQKGDLSESDFQEKRIINLPSSTKLIV